MPYRINSDCDEKDDISMEEREWCEYCGKVDPHTPIWCDGDVWWCFDCAKYDKEFDLTADEKGEISILSKERYRAYLRRNLDKKIEKYGKIVANYDKVRVSICEIANLANQYNDVIGWIDCDYASTITIGESEVKVYNTEEQDEEWVSFPTRLLADSVDENDIIKYSEDLRDNIKAKRAAKKREEEDARILHEENLERRRLKELIKKYGVPKEETDE